MENPIYNKEVNRIVANQPNLWYAFTAVTGISKLFSYTPKEIVNNPVKDSQSGTEINSSDT
jgi:hypothetical protein